MPQTAKTCLIGIAGPSCAGKTAVARRVATVLGAPVIGLDAYYRDLAHLPLAERAQANFDVPGSLDEELLIEQVGLMAQGRKVEVPVYNFAHHVRSSQVQIITPTEFVVVEGLFTLYWEALRRMLKVKAFVHAGEGACLDRRIERDVRERGRTRESVLWQYEATVRPMAEKYILPTRVYADLVLDGAGPLDESVAAVLNRIFGGAYGPKTGSG